MYSTIEAESFIEMIETLIKYDLLESNNKLDNKNKK